MSEQTNNNILMYMHAGASNHGCEAIVRSLCRILGDDDAVTLLSNNRTADVANGLDGLCNVVPVRPYDGDIVHKTVFYLSRHITGRSDAQMKYAYDGAAPFDRYRIALSIGGDNYCYPDALTNLRGANLMFSQASVPTALVGCSVEPDILRDPGIIEDLSRYSLIIARERISFDALREALPVDRRERIHLLPDPAFTMEPEECELPTGFEPGHTIGINLSPMIIDYESADHPGITMENYINLIKTILERTDDRVALIPHVVMPASDDRTALSKLAARFEGEERLIQVQDMTAPKLKYLISRCRLLIAARTHASIAAYSTCVPTLVAGYSVKSVGIATDLFGTADGYVCPVKDLKTPHDLTDAYLWLEDSASTQREILESQIPEVRRQADEIGALIHSIFIP